MNAKKLTAATIRAIKKSRANGARFADIAAEFGVSLGSVSAALKSPGAPKKAKSKPADTQLEQLENAPVQVENADDVDPAFSSLLKTVDAMAAAAASDNDVSRLATLGRLAGTLREHRRKSAPPADAPDGYFVTRASEEAAAAKVRARFHSILERIPTGPKCPTCNRETEIPE